MVPALPKRQGLWVYRRTKQPVEPLSLPIASIVVCTIHIYGTLLRDRAVQMIVQRADAFRNQ